VLRGGEYFFMPSLSALRWLGKERRQMSPDFVAYSPEIETVDPNIEELMAQIIDFWEKTVRDSPTREGPDALCAALTQRAWAW
jgi:hypothetical protein